MSEELISVVIPVYNIKEYLERCVDSVLNQTYQNLEILLVDDGSTDGTEKLVDELAEKDARIRAFHKENGGSSTARNLGIRNAKGAYLGFVDSDDYIEPNMYELLYHAVCKYHVPIAQGARDEIDESGKLLPDICVPPKKELLYAPRTFMEELLLHKGDCSFCTKLTRKDLLEKEPFPEGVLNEDFHVLVKLLPKINGIISLPERVYHVFYKSNSNTRKSGDSFSGAFGDAVANADMSLLLVREHFPELERVAKRFGLYQRMDYLLQIPISKMNEGQKGYKSIVLYLKRHRKEILTNPYLTKKNKLYLFLFSVAPKKVKQIHAGLRKRKD